MRVAAAIFTLLIAGSAAAQGVLPSEEEVAVLEACVAAAGEQEKDIALCRGILAGPCVAARGGETAGPGERAICLQSEEFAWKLADARAGTRLLALMEGREGFSKEGFLAELEARNAALREQCFRFPPGQELRVVACMLDGAVVQLGTTLSLIRAAEEAGGR